MPQEKVYTHNDALSEVRKRFSPSRGLPLLAKALWNIKIKYNKDFSAKDLSLLVNLMRSLYNGISLIEIKINSGDEYQPDDILEYTMNKVGLYYTPFEVERFKEGVFNQLISYIRKDYLKQEKHHKSKRKLSFPITA